MSHKNWGRFSSVFKQGQKFKLQFWEEKHIIDFQNGVFFCRQRSTRMRQNPDPVKNSPSSKNTQEPFSDFITLNEEGTGAVYNRVMHSSPIVMFMSWSPCKRWLCKFIWQSILLCSIQAVADLTICMHKCTVHTILEALKVGKIQPYLFVLSKSFIFFLTFLIFLPVN